MKKSGVLVLVISTLLIGVICSASLVSASFWNDFWSKITGKVIEENITAEPVAENIAVECTDSDGGLDYYTKGAVTFSEGTMTDTCVGDKLTEWICDERGIAEDEDYVCPYGCSDGACLKEAPPPTQQCTDSDDGKNYYVAGSVSIGAEGKPWTAPIRDSCIDKFTLEEGYCKNGNMLSEKYKCPNGCEDGACIRGEEPKPSVPEVPPTEVVRICAAKIKITFDKEIYYYGDYPKVVVEIFDSQGTHIPNYDFYSKIYTYADGLWHTGDSAKTDQDGYFITQEGRIEEGKQAAGKTKLKVFTPYTGKYADCNSVEDIVEFEIRKGEKEEVCGIGVCVPEEVTEIEEIPEEKILYACMGCELEDKCYPMGYRKEGKYCSSNYEFVNQIEEGACDNNFECKSNVCVSGECVSESLMKKIINWFKKLFGIEPEEPELIEPKAEMCSDWLIEKNIRDYKYSKSAYGHAKESQVPLYSEGGEQIGVVKCCVAGYLEPDGESKGTSALVCPFDNRADIENSLKWLSARGELTLGEYKGQEVYNVGNAIIWTHKEFILVVGIDPKVDIQFPEDIANAYLEKYKNDLEDIEIPKRDIPYEPKPWVVCTEEDEKAVKECLSRPNSKLQTDPHPEKDCEVYVGCILPDESKGYQDSAKEFLIKAETIGELTLIDFETLADGKTLQNGDKLTGKEWKSLGVVFETPSEEYLKVFGPMYPFNPLDKLSLSPGFGPFESGSDTHDNLNIIFSEPVKAAGIYLLDLGETDERESIIFLDKNNNVIKKISPWPKSTFGNPAPGTFVGLIHEEGISKIEILENTQDSDDIAYDNLYFVK